MLALVVGLITTAILSFYYTYTKEARLHQLLNDQTKVLVDDIQRRVNLYITTLRSGADVLDKGHFETFEERFLLFCQSQRFQNPNTGINEIGFIPAISLNPPVPQNVISQLCSVQEGVMIKYHADRTVNPMLFETLHQPIGEGQVVASPFFNLSFRPFATKSEGQIFYYPIGNYDHTLKSKMSGNPKLLGWLFLTLRKSFLAERIRALHNSDLQVRLETTNGSPALNTLVYESSVDALKGDAVDPAYRVENTLAVAGRNWKLTTGFKRTHVDQVLRTGTEFLWTAGIAISLFLALLVAILRNRFVNRAKYPEGQDPFDRTLALPIAEDRELLATTAPPLKEDMTAEGLWEQASVDPLTQLPTKALLMDRLRLEIGRAERDGHLFGLLVFGVDQFDQIEDAHGEPVAKALTQTVAQKTTAMVRSTDTVAYLGRNTFAILLAQQHDIQHLTQIAYKILEQLECTIAIQEHDLAISVSIGVSVYPDDGRLATDLLEHAIHSHTEAAHQGGSRVLFYSQPLGAEAGERRILVQEIRKAIDKGQLFVRFQPVLNLQTGKPDKAEALIRWESPERGEIKPADFIALAEEAGLIVEIGDFVFAQTVAYLHKWRKILPEHFQVSINISPQQLRLSKQISQHWRELLEKKKVSGQAIVLEITEGMLLHDDRQIIQSIYALRDAGIRFCLDDFGTGYSSIAYLKKLDIDYLKIDQSFVRELSNNEDDQKIVEGVLLLAKKLGMQTIAEGVETKAQFDYLRQFGCEYGQGFYFARAMLPDEFIEWIKERLA